MSQRRRNNIQRDGQGHDLTGQDSNMDRESGLWVPASAHKGEDYEDEEEDEDERAGSIQDSAINGEQRGRQENVAA